MFVRMGNMAKQTSKVEKKFCSFGSSGSWLEIRVGNISLLMATNHRKQTNSHLYFAFGRQLRFFKDYFVAGPVTAEHRKNPIAKQPTKVSHDFAQTLENLHQFCESHSVLPWTFIPLTETFLFRPSSQQ